MSWLFNTVSAVWNKKRDWHDPRIFGLMSDTVPIEVSFLFADIAWHYFEEHHGKCPKGDVKGIIKNMVFVKVFSSSTVINTFKVFAEFVTSTISCLCLPRDDLLQESDHVKECTPIPNTIKTHKIGRSFTSKGDPCNKFFQLSNNVFCAMVWFCLRS